MGTQVARVAIDRAALILFAAVSCFAHVAPALAQSSPDSDTAASSTADAAQHETPEEIIVTGERRALARGAQLGALGNRDIMETPFNIHAYTSELIADLQARGVADILDNDPATRVTWSPAAGYTYEEYTIRGILVNSMDVTLNGLAGLSPTGAMPAESIERLEVLKGPNAMLGGVGLHGSLGGAINVVPKRASEEPLTRLTGTFDSDSQFGTHADIGRRFGSGNEFGVRFNGVYRDGDTALEQQSLRLVLATIGLDYRSANYRLSLDAGHHARDRDVPQQQIAVQPGFNLPAPPASGANFQQSWAHIYAQDTWFMVRGEYDFASDWTAFVAYGRRQSDMDTLVSLQRLINADGDINQTFAYIPRWQKTPTGELGVRGSFATGGVTHDISVVASALRQDFGAFNSIAPGGITNLYDPVNSPLPAAIDTDGAVLRNSRNGRASLAVSDIISVDGGRLQFLLGGRWQQVKTSSFTRDGERSLIYDKTSFTPAFGIVFKPRSDVSLYTNYIEGLTQPFAPGGAINSAEVFPPLRTRQVELGAKMEFGSLLTGISVFNITQPKSIIDPSTLIFSVDGEQRVRGIDMNFNRAAAGWLRLLGGITLLDSEQTRTAGGVDQGNRGIGVPRVQLNLGADVDVAAVDGLMLSARALHTGRQFADASNQQSLSDWTRFDLGVRYTTGTGRTPVTMRANVENLFDKTYWASAARDLTSGAPRTYKLSVSVDF